MFHPQALRGNPQFFTMIQADSLVHHEELLEAYVPLFEKIRLAKQANRRPSEEEDSALFWGWDCWDCYPIAVSGCGAPILGLYLHSPRGEVEVARYFAGDRCNAPGKWNGWEGPANLW